MPESITENPPLLKAKVVPKLPCTKASILVLKGIKLILELLFVLPKLPTMTPVAAAAFVSNL